MPEGAYELGIDIGTSSVVAAISRPEPGGASRSLVTCHAALSTVLTAWSAGRSLDETSAADLLPPPGGLLDRVGDATPLRVGTRTATPADVVAGLVRLIVDRITAHEGRAPTGTAVAVPPSWGGHRRAALVAALQTAGVGNATPVSAAVSAVRAHVETGDLPPDVTAVVVDLGAATTDVAVVGPREDGELDHRAVPPAPLDWGGRDVDDAVLRHVRPCLELPARLASPAERKRGKALRAACRVAKEAASLDTEVAVAVDPAWSAIPVRLTREELEAAVADDVDRLVTTAVDAIAAAGTTAEELSGVVLTGGASRMPLVAERLSDALALPLCTAADPALTTALGAALVATDLRAADEEVADGAAEAATGRAAALPRRTGRKRAGATSRPSGGAGNPARRGTARPPAGRVAVVAALFLLLVVGPSVALALVGAGPGVATDGTAAAGDLTASTPTTSQAGTDTAPETIVDGAAATSNAGHEVDAPSRSRTSRHATSSGTTSRAGTTLAAPAARSSTAARSSSATVAAAAAATTATTTAATTTPPPVTTTPPPVTSDPPPVTSDPPPVSSDPPPPSSSAPAPVPDPPANGSSTDTGTTTGTTDTSSAPGTPPATDSAGPPA